MRFRLSFAALMLATYPAAVHACSCFNAGPRNALRRSAAVFLGRVVSTTPRGQERDGEIRVAQFKVTHAIKGVDAGQTKAVEYLVDTGGNCGLPLGPGMKLLVYAMPATNGQTPWADYCTGTKLQECAAPDLRALGVAVPRGSRDCSISPPKRSPAPPPRDSASRPALI